jgi:hypothetical protein
MRRVARLASGWGNGERGLDCDPSALLARPNLFPDLFPELFTIVTIDRTTDS